MSLKRKRGFLRPDEDDAQVTSKRWKLPDYTSEVNKDIRETAFNYDPSWTYSQETSEAKSYVELTDEELGKIKESARQEGYLHGKETGFNAGYEKGKEQGLQEGQEEGLELGKAEGIQAGQELIQQQVEHFMSLADQLVQPLESMNAQVEKQLVDMVLALTREVVHIEVQTNPQIILDTIKESIEALPILGHTIRLKLHPEDAAIIHSAYGDDELSCRGWTLVNEPSLNRGDVQIEAGDSSVNYKMEERVRSVIQSFYSANQHKGTE